MCVATLALRTTNKMKTRLASSFISSFMEMASEATTPQDLGNSAAPTSQRSSLAKQAAKLLHRRFKVVVKDGRVLLGELTCLDKQGNLILANTYEQMDLNGRKHEKQMGLVLVPAEHRVSCELEAMPQEVDSFNQMLQQVT